MLYISEAFYASENSLLFNIFVRYAQDNRICEILYCSIVKKIHKVMLSDVIVNIFNSHMTLFLNIMTAQGFFTYH